MSRPAADLPVTDDGAEHRQLTVEPPTDAAVTTTGADVPLGAEPGSAPAMDEPVPQERREVWEPARANHFRAEWREVQMRFVDDPPGATRQAVALVDDVVQALTAALQEQTRAIREQQNSAHDKDTQSQLTALRECRALFNRVVNF